MTKFEKQIIELYQQYHSISSVADELYISKEFVKDVLKRNKIELKHMQRWKTRRNRDVIHEKFVKMFQNPPKWLLNAISKLSKEKVMDEIRKHVKVSKWYLKKYYMKQINEIITKYKGDGNGCN